MSEWQTLGSRIVYENPWIRVREDSVINPGGKEGVYGVIESKSESVYVVPLDNEGNTYIVNQFRYTLQKNMWECVAGHVDEDDIVTGAKRELLEETGVKATDIEILGEVYAADGIATSKSYVCIARGLDKITDQLDEMDGILGAKKLPLSEVCGMIVRGEITCATSIAAFLMVQASLQQ